MNNDKKPEKIEFRNKRDTGKILTIIFFVLVALILLITLLLVYTPLKDIIFKKPIVEVTSEESMGEPTEVTTEETAIEPTEKTGEETTVEPTEEVTETTSEDGKWTFIDIRDAKHQGIVKDIDYENKIITIENANTGEIEKLDKFTNITMFSYMTYIENKLHALDSKFEDVRVGYYTIIVTEEDFNPDDPEPDFIWEIRYSEKKWW